MPACLAHFLLEIIMDIARESDLVRVDGQSRQSMDSLGSGVFPVSDAHFEKGQLPTSEVSFGPPPLLLLSFVMGQHVHLLPLSSHLV